jgi:hypothetical protein
MFTNNVCLASVVDFWDRSGDFSSEHCILKIPHARNKMNTDIVLRLHNIVLRLHNIVSKSALHFGSETWTLRKEGKRWLEASHMRFLRPIIGVTRRDRLTNDEIRKLKDHKYCKWHTKLSIKLETTCWQDGRK